MPLLQSPVQTTPCATGIHPSARRPTEVDPQWVLALLALLSTALSVSYSQFAVDWPERDWPYYCHLGQAGLVGFWMANGRGRWWFRTLGGGLLIAILCLGDNQPSIHLPMLFVLFATATAMCSWAFRQVLEFAAGEVPLFHFSLLRLMAMTAICGLIAFGIDAVVPWRELEHGPYYIAELLLELFLFGTIVSLQCLPLLTRTWKSFGTVLVLSIMGVLLSPVLGQLLQSALVPYPLPFEFTLQMHWVSSASVWLTIFPLEFGLRNLGWSLFQE